MKKLQCAFLSLSFVTCIGYAIPSASGQCANGVPTGSVKFATSNQLTVGINFPYTFDSAGDLNLVSAAGIKYVRNDLRWDSVEKVKGVYDYSNFDILINNLKVKGMRAILILDNSNSLYETRTALINGRSVVYSPQTTEVIQAFSNFAMDAVQHFSGNGVVFEIWNEPDLSWSPNSNVTQYTTFAKKVAHDIRMKVQNAVIIGPAISSITLAANKAFLNTFLDSGGLDDMDAVSVHPYRNAAAIPETVIPEFLALRSSLDNKDVFTSGKPIVSSEWGFSTPQINPTLGVTATVQAQWLVRMQLINLLCGIPLSSMYTWQDFPVPPFSDIQGNFGIAHVDKSAKPSYLALQALLTHLNGYSYVRRQNVVSGQDYIIVFVDGAGKYKLAAWTSAPDHQANIPNSHTSGNMASAVDGTALPGLQLTIPAPTNNSINLNLTSLPQYVTLNDWTLENNPSTTFEAEGLVTSTSSGATQVDFTDANASNGMGNKLDSTAVDQYVDYSVTLPTAGTYSISIRVKQAPNRGKFKLYLPQANLYVGNEQDQYAATGTYTEINIGTNTFASAGVKQFRLIVTGKNAASTDYTLTTDYIKVIPF